MIEQAMEDAVYKTWSAALKLSSPKKWLWLKIEKHWACTQLED